MKLRGLRVSPDRGQGTERTCTSKESVEAGGGRVPGSRTPPGYAPAKFSLECLE